jgi:hypothetical protein
VAARVYMLSCRWIDSGRVAVLRGRGERFIRTSSERGSLSVSFDRASTLAMSQVTLSGHSTQNRLKAQFNWSMAAIIVLEETVLL